MTTLAAPTILDAMTDPQLFGRWFGGPSWAAWRVCVAALFGVPMTEAERVVFTTYTGRSTPPTTPAREAWLIVGRRGGKDRIASLVAVWLACFKDYSAILAPGEWGVVMVLAADRRQARVAFRYIRGLLQSVPELAALIERETQDAIYLRNHIVIEIHTASYRAIRGYTVVAGVNSEVAFWRSDDTSANPDREILNGRRPAMASVPGAMQLNISTPFAKLGELHKAYQRHWAQDGDPVLVWRARTIDMNPTIDPDVIAEARRDDPVAAAAEYDAVFRDPLGAFVSREVIDRSVRADDTVTVDPRVAYALAVDVAGGSGEDSFALAVAHAEPARTGHVAVVVDFVGERRPPFAPTDAVAEVAAIAEDLGVREIHGDRSSFAWVEQEFRAHGLRYQPVGSTTSENFLTLLSLLNSGRVSLPPDETLRRQLGSLQRRVTPSGHEAVEHPRGQHDDMAAACAAAVAVAYRGVSRRATWEVW